MNVHTEMLVLPLYAAQAQSADQTIAAIWIRLTDLACWEQWLPNSITVAILDTGEVARGTRLQVDTEMGTEVWRVEYWDAGRRIVFRITQGSNQRACSIETRRGDDQSIDILFTMEFELKGIRRLMRPLLVPIYERRARLYANKLRMWLLDKVPE